MNTAACGVDMFKIPKAFFLVASLHLAAAFLLQAQPSQENLIHVEIAGSLGGNGSVNSESRILSIRVRNSG